MNEGICQIVSPNYCKRFCLIFFQIVNVQIIGPTMEEQRKHSSERGEDHMGETLLRQNSKGELSLEDPSWSKGFSST